MDDDQHRGTYSGTSACFLWECSNTFNPFRFILDSEKRSITASLCPQRKDVIRSA